MRCLYSLTCILLLATVVMMSATPAYACLPGIPTPWFTEELTFTQVTLPPGVQLHSGQTGTIVLSNSTTTPLYVIGRLNLARTTYEELPVTLPPDTGPLHKLLNGEVYNCRSVFNGKDQPPVLYWDEDFSKTAGLELKDWHNSVDAGEGSLIPQPTLNQAGDDRSPNVVPPPPQHTALTLVYAGHLISIPLTITYFLNQDYDPHSVATARSACDNVYPFRALPPLRTIACIAVLLLLEAAAIAMLLIKWVRRWHDA